MDMKGEKRRREDDGVKEGKKGKSEEDNGMSSSVTEEEEVEEFFAILRRIHAADNCFERNNGVERRLTDQRWRPSFVLEDFNDVKDEMKKEDDPVSVETLEVHSGLDLNSVPTSK